MAKPRSQFGNNSAAAGPHPESALTFGRASGCFVSSHRKAFILKGFAFSRRHLMSVAAVAATATGFGGIASKAMATGTLNGAGSTLVAPFEAEWAQGFDQKYGDTVNYNAVGSGTGITDISQRIVDFGASDAPLTPDQASQCNNCTQIPWALSATGVGYNVPGVGSRLRLTGATLAGIYLGQITNWDAPAIKRSNPGLRLPNLKITPIFRSDGSGDTYAFTNYLTDVSKTWAGKVNYATSVQFPAGIGGKGNSGVASLLSSTQGGIAYIAVSYLISQHLHAAAIQNSAGNYEYPNLTNIENAAAVVKSVPASNALHIVDPPRSAKVAYPISTFTYAIVPKSGNKQAALLKAFINYAITTGQRTGASLDFAPLPRVVLARDKSVTAGLS
jgi:phosphate transport system substrate-binding protein